MSDFTLHQFEVLAAEAQGYVAFVDVLGYKAIIDAPVTDGEKLRRLYSVMACIGEAVRGVKEGSAGTDLKVIGFSDCLYFRSRDFTTIVAAVRSLFASTFGMRFDDWVPYLRGAIVKGWTIDLLDPTVSTVEVHNRFRNPVGPAVAHAYTLSEVTLRLAGMRCVIDETALADGVASTLPERIRLLPVPDVPERPHLREIAWPDRILDTGTNDFLDVLASTRWQFGADVKHLQGTARLAARCLDAGDHRRELLQAFQ